MIRVVTIITRKVKIYPNLDVYNNTIFVFATKTNGAKIINAAMIQLAYYVVK